MFEAQRARILLVDDDRGVLEVNRKYLEGQGYSVETAETLKKARAALWENPPDLVVLDVQLPDGLGFDFCAELRGMSTAPVIFLTAMGGDMDVVRGLMGGGDDYMVKPYSLQVLGARIAARLRRGAGASRIELPPLYIDLLRGEARLEGREIPLTQKELQLLAFFAANAGREFTSGQIYAAVWGEDSQASRGTVKTHISNLRRKLKLDDYSPFELCLTRNKGYMLLKVRFEGE